MPSVAQAAHHRRSGRSVIGALGGMLLLSTSALAAGDGDAKVKAVDRDGNVRALPAAAGAGEAGPPSNYVGKLERALAERLAGARSLSSGKVRVVYVLEMPAGSDSRDADGAPRLEATAARVREVNARMAERLTQAGHRIVYSSPYTAMIVAEAPAAAIEAMAGEAEVDRVYLERTHAPRLNISRIVSQGKMTDARRLSGDGVRVGVVEGGHIASHPNLPNGQLLTCGGATTFSTSGHKTSVAGVIQSTHAKTRGIAPGVLIIDGVAPVMSDAQLMAATDCVISQGAVAVNMSFGSETNGFFNGFARFVDRLAYLTGRAIVVAVSNSCVNRVGSPEIAFNALGVGSYSDRNTGSGKDDRHSCDFAIAPQQHSAFRNPFSPNGDREEPKMVAPGHLISAPSAGGGLLAASLDAGPAPLAGAAHGGRSFASVTGTSFAAPHVVGAAALLAQRRPELAGQGELVRAILMASARKNIEGDSRLSDRDGAGALQVAAADRVLLNDQAWFLIRPGGTEGFPISQTFEARKKERVRVVTVWSHKGLDDLSTQPSTDLDLVVRGPTGEVLGASHSFDNAYEIVEFKAPATGTYTAVISNFRPSNGAEFIGLAVSRHDK